ncbi:MAG: PHP domain-containing protein [Chloroflexi bacterium]|nr:PHP domain-containing protein [Chloroflexota bacterium]
MASFTHLHTHSGYSFLDGLPSPTELAQAAANDGMDALALTDHHGLTGAIEFYDACRAIGLRPILGMEATVNPPADWPRADALAEKGNLVLLAMDLDGWRSLCRLSTLLQTAPDRDPTRGLTFDQLTRNTTGPICLTGGARRLAAKLILAGPDDAARGCLARLADLFRDRLYVELQKQSPADDELASRLARAAQQVPLPIVATNSVHYLTPGQAELQRTFTAMRLNRPLSDLPRDAAAPPGSHFVSTAEMVERFADLPEAIAATREIADRCRLELNSPSSANGDTRRSFSSWRRSSPTRGAPACRPLRAARPPRRWWLTASASLRPTPSG